MVPGDEPVIETKDHVGDAEVIETWPRQALEYCTPVIAYVAGNTTLKRRESWDGIRRIRREERSRNTQGISRDGDPFACWTAPNLGEFTLTADDANGIGSEEGIVCIRVIASGAVEKQQVWKIEEPAADLSGIFRMPERLDQWCEAAQSSLRRSPSAGSADPLARLPADLRER
jgi:hypothetical protein